MTRWMTLALLALLTLRAEAQQHPGGSAPARGIAPREAAQFDFLVGQWEVIARPAVSGLAARLHGAPKFPGTWKAWRGLDGWGIQDELRLTDASGNPRVLSHTVRVYDASASRWNTSTLDVYRGSFAPGTAEWRNGRMELTSRGTEQDGRTVVLRTRFSDITSTSFRFQQDRSYDDGRTWSEGVLKIEAKRVAAVAPR